MSYQYKIKKPCFIQGVLRKPGDPRYDPYVVEKQFNPCPSALELITKSASKKPVDRAKPVVPGAPKPDQVQPKGPGQNVKFED